MNPRNLVMAVSALALLAVAGIAVIALAFVGGGDEASGRTAVVVASPTATLAPAAATPPPEPQTTRPPAPTTIGAAPKPTFTPTVPAPPSTPTVPPPPPSPEPPTRPGPRPPAPPSPVPGLPDLAVLDLTVSGNRVTAVIGNLGRQAVPAGTAVQLALRGAVAGSSTLPQGLAAGGSFTLLLAQAFVHRSESVTAVVDPNNLIPEANEANNGLTRQVEPDILLDLALTGLSAVGSDEHLAVGVRNNSSVPARQVTARLSVYRSGSGSPLSVTIRQLDLEPQGTITLAPGVSAVRGLSLRVVLEVVGITDGNPGNNVLESSIP